MILWTQILYSDCYHFVFGDFSSFRIIANVEKNQTTQSGIWSHRQYPADIVTNLGDRKSIKIKIDVFYLFHFLLQTKNKVYYGLYVSNTR